MTPPSKPPPAPRPFTIEDMEKLSCLDSLHGKPLHVCRFRDLKQACHPDAPLRVAWDTHWKVLVTACGVCGRGVVTIAVARASDRPGILTP